MLNEHPRVCICWCNRFSFNLISLKLEWPGALKSEFSLLLDVSVETASSIPPSCQSPALMSNHSPLLSVAFPYNHPDWARLVSVKGICRRRDLICSCANFGFKLRHKFESQGQRCSSPRVFCIFYFRSWSEAVDKTLSGSTAPQLHLDGWKGNFAYNCLAIKWTFTYCLEIHIISIMVALELKRAFCCDIKYRTIQKKTDCIK